MNEMNNATTFIGLLGRCTRIVVPQIQRDYAQGRETESEVRLDFLNALCIALNPEAGSGSPPLNLDFIYGSMEGEGDGLYFLPLDGQQRLTTLLLLHWYLAWRDGGLEDFQSRLWDGRHSRFTYKVRPSSAEFFDDLVRFVPGIPTEDIPSIRRFLENQHWFFLNWRLDPTIQSALTMLDAIHVRFRTSAGLYARLLDEVRPAITFQLLQLENFGLSDDLYIKMNARGKPLTPFETFKARFEEDLKTLFPDEQRKIGSKSWNMRDYFAQRMDTRWTDFFWGYRPKGSKVFDTEVMNLFWTVAQLSLDPESKTFVSDTSALQNKQAVVNYSTLRDGGWLTRDFANQLTVLLDAWSVGGGALTRQMDRKHYFDEETLFQKSIKAPAALNYAELLQFNAFVLYLTQWPNEVVPDELEDWMRLISNLAVNTSYDHIDVFQRCMTSVRKILPESRKILSSFAEMDATRLSGFSPQQVQEEVLKAKLILAESGWRGRIELAEEHDYFKGQIEFLLDFSGLRDLKNGDHLEALTTLDHLKKQAVFDDFLVKATLTFGRDGLKEPAGAKGNTFLWQRALLAVGDYLIPLGSNQSFGTNNADNPDSWKRFLRGGRAEAEVRRSYLMKLWEKLDGAALVWPQLEHIINDTTGLEYWRDEIVKHPQVIEFCIEKEIRKVSENKVYLLRKRQLNGAHAELFSYVLYLDWAKIGVDDQLVDLMLTGYSSVSGSFVEPQVKFSLIVDGFRVELGIESSYRGLQIVVDRKSIAMYENIKAVLVSEMLFKEEYGELVRGIGYGCVVQVLRQLVRVLTKALTAAV